MTRPQLSPAVTEQIDQLCALSPIIPVLTIDRVEDAVPLAEALVEGGLPVLEITLRTEAALAAIEAISKAVPEASVGAGTVLNPQQFRHAVEAGSGFIISPGLTDELLDYGIDSGIPLLPGIQNVSELMTGLEQGYRRFKFFPAAISGGPKALQAFQGPFRDVRFCPTGGIRANSARDYLTLDNVACVGGTWLTPPELVAAQDWSAICNLARESLQQVRD